MLWTCLHFPDLPLSIFERGDARERPAVVSSASHRPDVVAANGAARKRGIVPGLSIAAALALDAQVLIHLRDERAETRVLESIALWAVQWTPTISIEPPACVLLEVSGGLNYFGGLDKLLERIDSGLAAMGLIAAIAIAPTPGAASLFARAGEAIVVECEADCDRRLLALPVALLASAQGVLDTLAGVGVRTLGDVLALPRDGVARRFGQSLLDEIDRARGGLPDARPLFTVPERYHGQIELPSPVDEAQALLFAARRLVVELSGFLRGRGAGVSRLRCDLVHEDAQPTSIMLGLTCTRQIEHIMNVLRERLARERLPDRVEAIRLASEEIAPLAAKEGDFFPATGKDDEPGAQLIERLRARLGEDAVHALALRADHRPERAWGETAALDADRACHPECSEGSAVRRRPADSSSRHALLGMTAETHDSSPVPARPLWLLPAPRPLGADPAAAQLKLLSGPERIETGWWDGGEVGRDYFIGCNPRGEELWLYRDRGGEWFVHGLFS
ncbi:MAG TPA: DNA polymerase Y family protein [Casimicrobiaceae bacterium]|nr:DNA polymerase Y family protein [Casimicrobiaceae bacterium]